MRNPLLIALLPITITSCHDVELVNVDFKDPSWTEFSTNSESSLRGLSAVDSLVCWVSGSEGTVLLTIDGGKTWLNRSIPGMDSLQFRDIQAFNKDTAMVLSAGLPAIIAKTVDGGKNWNVVYQNVDEGVFFDAVDFWNEKQGIAFSDAPEDKLLIIRTNDGGNSWFSIPDSLTPKVLEHQGGFAASGTCLRTFSEGKVIIGLGGDEASILSSADFGASWSKSSAPLDHGAPSKGIYSFDESNGLLICTGGDYLGDSVSNNSIAKSMDFGKSWELISDTAVSGHYRSCLSFINNESIIAVSRTGASYSIDRGLSWTIIDGAYYSVSVANDGSTWASGSQGRVAKLKWF